MLVVKGVRSDGQRELLADNVADSDSEATYDALLRRLKERDLQGVQLVTSDDQRGLMASIQRHFQAADSQRCPSLDRNARGKVAITPGGVLTGA